MVLQLLKKKKKVVKPKKILPAERRELKELKGYFQQRGLIKKKVFRKISLEEVLWAFPEKTIAAFVKIKDIKYYKTILNAIFGGVVALSPGFFDPLKKAVDRSDIKLLPDSYVGLMGAGSFAAAVGGAIFSLLLSIIFRATALMALAGMAVFALTGFLMTFTIFYAWPFHMVRKKRVDIDTNLPFAINHMAAVAASGIPPEKAFEMLVEFREYGAVSDEAGEIVKRIQVLGEDITTAIRAVGAKTPSTQLKELFYGILSVIESGGNLREYLRQMAALALFNYKLSRKRYLETLSMYADIYTAILIAAPLFMVAILAVMNLIPGAQFGGMTIEGIISLGTYVAIPAVNIGFLIFLTVTQPKL